MLLSTVFPPEFSLSTILSTDSHLGHFPVFILMGSLSPPGEIKFSKLGEETKSRSLRFADLDCRSGKEKVKNIFSFICFLVI